MPRPVNGVIQEGLDGASGQTCGGHLGRARTPALIGPPETDGTRFVDVGGDRAHLAGGALELPCLRGFPVLPRP